MGFISVSLSELDPLSSGYRLTITGCNSGDTEVLVASGLTNPDDFPYVFNSDDFLDDGSCFYYNLVDVNSGCQISGSIGTTTPTPTPTNTVTPTPSNTALGIDIGVNVTSGSTVVTLTFTASFNVRSNTTVNFEQKLFRTNGTTYTIKDSVVILSGQNVATKTYRLSEDYTNFRPFEYSITNLTSSNDEVTFNKYSTATFAGQSNNLVPYIFESCCDRTKTISVLVPNSATINGWVNQGYIIVFKDECYKPKIKGGLGNNGTYYGFDYKSCYDSPCLCVTPTPTPTVTPTKTPIAPNSDYTTVVMEDIFGSDFIFVANVPNESINKIFFTQGRCMKATDTRSILGTNSSDYDYLTTNIYDTEYQCKLENNLPLNVTVSFTNTQQPYVKKPKFNFQPLIVVDCDNPCYGLGCTGATAFEELTTVNVLTPCGETLSNPDIYVWYDRSGSYSPEEVRQASKVVRKWYLTQVATRGYTGRLFEAPFTSPENYLSFFSYQKLRSTSGGTLSDGITQITGTSLNNGDLGPKCSSTSNNLHRELLQGSTFLNEEDISITITGVTGSTTYYFSDYSSRHPVVSSNPTYAPGGIIENSNSFSLNNKYFTFDPSVLNDPNGTPRDPENAINIVFTNEYEGMGDFSPSTSSPDGIIPINIPCFDGNPSNDTTWGGSDVNCERLRSMISNFYTVWKDAKENGKTQRNFVFLFPKNTSVPDGVKKSARFLLNTIALVEGEPVVGELQSKYVADYDDENGNPVTTTWPEINPYLNFASSLYPSIWNDFSLLETQAPFSGLTALTAYEALGEYANGPGLKNYGVQVNAVLSAFTEDILTQNLCNFINLELLEALSDNILLQCNNTNDVDFANGEIPCYPAGTTLFISGYTDQCLTVLENNLTTTNNTLSGTGVYEVNVEAYGNNLITGYTISDIVLSIDCATCIPCQEGVEDEVYSGYTYLNEITLVAADFETLESPIDVTVYGGTASTIEELSVFETQVPPSFSGVTVYKTDFSPESCINLEFTMENLPPNIQIKNIGDCCDPVPSQTPTPTVTPTMTPTPTETPTQTPTETPTQTPTQTPPSTPPSTPTPTPTTTSTPTPTPTKDIICNVTLSTDQPETPELCSDDVLVNITVTNGSDDGTDSILSLSSITSNVLLNSNEYSYESSDSVISLTIPSQTYQNYGEEYQVCVITDLNCQACTAFTITYVLPPLVQKFELCNESIGLGITPYTGSTVEYQSYNIPLEINSICDLEPLADQNGFVSSNAIVLATSYYVYTNLYSSILDWNEDGNITTADVLYALQNNGNETGPTAFNLFDYEACLSYSPVTIYNNNSDDLNLDETYFIDDACWTYKGLVENCLGELPVGDFTILNTSYDNCQTCIDINFPEPTPPPTPTPTPTPIPVCEIFPKDLGVKVLYEESPRADGRILRINFTSNTVSHYFQPRSYVGEEQIKQYFPGYDLESQIIHTPVTGPPGTIQSTILPSICTYTQCNDMWESTFPINGEYLNQEYWDGIRVNRIKRRIFTCDYNCETSTPLLDENNQVITVSNFFNNYLSKPISNEFTNLGGNRLSINTDEEECIKIIGYPCDGPPVDVFVSKAFYDANVVVSSEWRFYYLGTCYEIVTVTGIIEETNADVELEYGTCGCDPVNNGNYIDTLPLIIYDEEKDIVFRIWTDEQESAVLNNNLYELTGEETVVIKELTNCEKNRDIFVTVDGNGDFIFNGVTGNTNVVLQKGHTYRFHVCSDSTDFWIGWSDSPVDIYTQYGGVCGVNTEIVISNSEDIINGVVDHGCEENEYGSTNCGTYLRQILYHGIATDNPYPNKTIIFRPDCNWDCSRVLFYYDSRDVSNDVNGNTVLNDSNKYGLIQLKEDPNNCRSNVIISHNGYIDEETGLIPDLSVSWIDCCGDSHTVIYEYPFIQNNPNWGEPFDFILPGCIRLNSISLTYAEIPSPHGDGLPSLPTQGKCWCGEKYDGTDCWSVCGESKPVFRSPDKSNGIYNEKDGYKVFAEKSEKLYATFTGKVTDKGECCGCCSSNVVTYNRDEYWIAKNCCDVTDHLIVRISRRIHGDIVLTGKGFLVDLPAQETVKCYYFDQRVSVGCNDSRNFYTVPPRDIVDNDCDDTATTYEEALELRKCLPCPSPPRVVECDLPYDTIEGIQETYSEIILEYGTQTGEIVMTFDAKKSSKRIQVLVGPSSFDLDGNIVPQNIPGSETIIADSLWVGELLTYHNSGVSAQQGLYASEVSSIINDTDSIPKWTLNPNCEWDVANYSSIWPSGQNTETGNYGWTFTSQNVSITNTESDIPVKTPITPTGYIPFYRSTGVPGQISVDPTYPSPSALACDGRVKLRFNKTYSYPTKLKVKVWSHTDSNPNQDGWTLHVECIEPCSKPVSLWYNENGPCDFDTLQCTEYELTDILSTTPQFVNVLDYTVPQTSTGSYMRCEPVSGPASTIGSYTYYWSSDNQGESPIIGLEYDTDAGTVSFKNGFTFNDTDSDVPQPGPSASSPESFNLENAYFTQNSGSNKKYRVRLDLYAFVNKTVTSTPLRTGWISDPVYGTNTQSQYQTEIFDADTNSGWIFSNVSEVVSGWDLTGVYVTPIDFWVNNQYTFFGSQYKIDLLVNGVTITGITTGIWASSRVWNNVELSDGDQLQLRVNGTGFGPGSFIVFDYLRLVIDRVITSGSNGITVFQYRECQFNTLQTITVTYPNTANICAVNGSISVISGEGAATVISNCGSMLLNNYFAVNTVGTGTNPIYAEIPESIQNGVVRRFVYNNVLVDYLNQYTESNEPVYQGINYFTVEHTGSYDFRARQVMSLSNASYNSLYIIPVLVNHNTNQILYTADPSDFSDVYVSITAGGNPVTRSWTFTDVYLTEGQRVYHGFVKVNLSETSFDDPEQAIYLYDTDSLFEITGFDFVPQLTNLFVTDNNPNGVGICDYVYFDPCCSLPVEGYFYMTAGTQPYILQSDSTGLIYDYCEQQPLPEWESCIDADYGFVLPGTFSPNGDGVFDTWNVVFVSKECWISFNVEVYNLYGQLIASFNALTSGWSGQSIAAGTYILKYIGIKGDSSQVSGTHTVSV